MNETQESIDIWGRETFGARPTNLRMTIRLNEEIAELLTKIAISDGIGAQEECADIYIFLTQLASGLGCNLQERVNEKMQINRQRQWKHDGTGCAQHIENADQFNLPLSALNEGAL